MTELFKNGYALLIGVTQNNIPSLALPDVAKDLTALKKVLEDPNLCAYPEDNIKLITGNAASRTGILDGLDWIQGCLTSNTSENETAIIYYSGHGWQDESKNPPDYYLVPFDVRQKFLPTTCLPAQQFAAMIAALQPRRLLVILDCCHASGMNVKDLVGSKINFISSAIPTELMMGQLALPVEFLQAKGVGTLQTGYGRVVLSSSQGNQSSYMLPDKQMSLFTFHLIEALTGHANPPENATEVRASEVISYVGRNVEQSARSQLQVEQTPHARMEGDFPIAMLLGGRGIKKGVTPPDPYVSAGIGSSSISSPPTGVNVVNSDIDDSQIAGGNIINMGETHFGDRINVGNITGSHGIAIGQGTQVEIHSGLSLEEIKILLAPVQIAIQQAPEEKQVQAQQQLNELEQEVAKGQQAQDSRIANLLNGIANLVPGSVSALVTSFTSPLLGSLAGPVTQFVIDLLRKK
jgi:hypothetical protein